MRILIIGANRDYSIERIYIKYLNRLGVEVSHFPAQELFYESYQSFLAKARFKLGISPIYNRINQKLKSFVEDSNPDVIWVFKGMEVFPETLIWIKARGIRIVNYNPDSPFIFSSRGSGNKNVTLSIAHYDLHFTYQKIIKKRLEVEFKAKVEMLPFGYDAEESELLNLNSNDSSEINEVCFLGNPDKERSRFIISLATAGVPISIYGHHWERFVKHRNVKIFQPAYGILQQRILRTYRVQLNLMRAHNQYSHNMRTFEVPGAGGIMVAPETPEHLEFFQHGSEAFFFKNYGDCLQIINHLLHMPLHESKIIRQAAQTRSAQSGYKYESRALQVLTQIQKLVG